MIYRGKIKEILFEFSPAEGENRGIIIICDGLPSVPKQKELISYFSSNGFFTVFPRYRGIWESEGEFLKESPIKDIEEIIDFIKNNKIIELHDNNEFDARNQNFYLLGSSFGGTVALSLIDNKNISKIIALSPIVDIKDHNKEKGEQDLFWLGGFIRRAFGQGYRFSERNWKKMSSGDLFNPPQEIAPEKAKNILIIYDKSDSATDYKKIEKYSLRNNIKTIELKKIGHVSFSKLSKEILNKIVNFLQGLS